MSFTFDEKTTDGVTTVYSFSFAGADIGYISKSDIIVEVRADGQDLWDLLDVSLWTLQGTNQIHLINAIASPSDLLPNLRVRRVVDKEQPYATFERGAMLDMASLNRSFIQIVESIQELLDGFYPDGFIMRQNLDMGGYKVINLGDGTDPKDAVNKSQLDPVIQVNDEQTARIEALEDSIDIVETVTMMPWYYKAIGGETLLVPPFAFTFAQVYINGIHQNNLDGAFTVGLNQITLAEPLQANDVIYAMLGTPLTCVDMAAMTYVVQQDTLIRDSITDLDAELTSEIATTNANLLALANRVTSAELDIDVLQAHDTTNTALLATHTTQIANNTTAINGLQEVTRKKMEVFYSGLTLTIPTTTTNFVNLIKTLTPTSGSLNAFFNTTSNKLNVYNDNATLNFKVNIVGNWTLTTTNRSMVMTFVGTNGNTIVQPRADAIAPDTVQFQTHFSVDAGGFMASNGVVINIQSNGSVFTATQVFITMEQVTKETVITPH